MSIVALEAVIARVEDWELDEIVTYTEASHKYIDLIVVRLRSQVRFLGRFGELRRARVVDARLVVVTVHYLKRWTGNSS